MWHLRRTAAVGIVVAAVLLAVVPGLVLRWDLERMISKQLPPELDELVQRAVADMEGGERRHGVDGPGRCPAAEQLSQEDIERYERDGFLVVRNALQPNELEAVNKLYDHFQENRNIPQAVMDMVTCSTYLFGMEKIYPSMADLIFRLPLHWLAQRLLGANKVYLINSILHYNSKPCNQEGSTLSTHGDYFSLPFTVERKQSAKGWHGDNGLVLWVAIDELSDQSVTMQIGRGSHRRYTEKHSENNTYDQTKYCRMLHDDFAREDDGTDPAFLESFVQLPTLYPGDAVLFNGFTYHRPIPFCKNGCMRSNSRRITLRYIDGERTRFRDDIPSKATHYGVRWCPSPFISLLTGEQCRISPGMALSEKALPIVINKGGERQVPYDGLDNQYMELDPLSYFIGTSLSVHHDTCGLISTYAKKLLHRTVYRFLPEHVFSVLGVPAPKPRPGEEFFLFK